jgi:tetratricopeptide (TPR) repeat protein
MALTPTAQPATTPRRSGSPGTGTRDSHPARRDRTTPQGTVPQWYAAPSATRPRDPRTAERLLRSTAPAPATYPRLFHAARVLLHTGRPRRTAAWCAKLHPVVQVPAWTAAFRALGAEALLQLGDLTAAEHEAAAAQNATGSQHTHLCLWPTALRAKALMAQGRYEEAAAHLEQSVPEPTWQSLPWLRARGRLHLAAHRHQEALAAFGAVARLARRYDTGRLPHLPWRSDVAETLLRLGRVDRARALLVEELAAAPAIGPRYHGIALRLLAATEEPALRTRTLARAATELRRCEDRPELARVLADFAHTLDVIGESSAADAFLRKSTHLAADCDAVSSCGPIRHAA